MSKKLATVVGIISYMFMEDADDSEDEHAANLLRYQQQLKKLKRVCIPNYYESVIDSYNLTDFRSHFRLRKKTVEKVLTMIGPEITRNQTIGGRPAHSIEKQLLLTLWMVANQECYRSVADRFNVAKATAWEYVTKITKVLQNISHDVIKWPSSYEIDETVEGFKLRRNLNGVIGAIDGMHIPITAPHEMPNSYINRHNYHSMVLQAVCNTKYKFTDCFTGVPGSVHDARVLRLSDIGKIILRGHNPHVFPKDTHLLGDSAYPNRYNLIVPYKDNGRLTARQKQFNKAHSATRAHIEQAFGILKGRFRILRHLNILRTDLIPTVIIACCVLHNIAIDLQDTDVDIYEEQCNVDNNYMEIQHAPDVAGQDKRNRLAEEIMRL